MASVIGKVMAALFTLVLLLAALGLVLELTGAAEEDVVGLPEETSTESPSEPAGEPEPAPEPEAPAEPDSEPVDELDLLSQECTEGDILSCDALYWLSPVGSDHEAQGEPYAALLFAWDAFPVSEQEALCQTITTTPPSFWAPEFLEGWRENADSGVTEPIVVEFFNWACATTT